MIIASICYWLLLVFVAECHHFAGIYDGLATGIKENIPYVRTTKLFYYRYPSWLKLVDVGVTDAVEN